MHNLSDTVENQLLIQTAQGDQIAFTQLFDAYHHALGAFVFGILKSREVAEEVVLDVFLKIWTTREVLADVQNFKAYLFTISRNAAISALRKAIRERTRQAQWENEQAPAQPVEPDNRELYFNLIDEAIEQLSPQRKKIYLLSRQQGMKYEDIAKELGLSRFTVRAHIQQSVTAITAFLKERVNKELMLTLMLLELLKK
jgi:RNA polymerase sigma-70 factor (family 1)